MTIFDLSFKGVLASSLGVIVNEQPPRTRAAERIEKIPVPARPGVLHRTEGEDVFDPITLAPLCTLMDPTKLDAVCAWLRGSGFVVLGDDPLYCYEATAINAIPLNRLLDGADPRSFTPTFECQPFRYLTTPAADIVKTVSGENIINPGTVASAPIIKIEGSGDILLNIGGGLVSLADVPGGIIVDCVMMECFTLDRSGFLNNCLNQDFRLIKLRTGTTTLSWTGSVTRVTITPNWRWL